MGDSTISKMESRNCSIPAPKLFRFTIILHPIIGTVTFPPNVIAQDVERIRVYKAHPSFPPEITCYTVIVPVLDNAVFWIVITLYCCQVVVSITASVGPLLYIVKFIKKGLTLSEETTKLQKILVISLFIQGAIHSIFIITPTFVQLYAIFFELHTTVYLVTLIILFREKSKIFRTYKWFIIVHVIINIATECYVSLFMLPVTYLPLPMFRCTGLKAVMILRTKHFFPKFAKWQLNFYRFSIIFHPIIGTVTFSPNVLAQDAERIRLFKVHPSFPPEITCYSVIVAVLDNEMFWVLITFYCCQIVVSVTGSLGPLLYIVKFIKKGLTLSAETAKLQKILVTFITDRKNNKHLNFSDIMHYSHIVSFPIYLVTLIILFRERSKIFRTYKWFIIVHVIINIATEGYVSSFMLPVTYLPLPMFRCTGWLGQWGLKAVMILQTKHFYLKYAKWRLNLYRFTLILHPIIGTLSFPPNVKSQEAERIRVFKAHPTFPPEITCYTVIVPVLDDVMFWVMLSLYCCQMVISVVGYVGSLLFIVKYIKKGMTLSKATAKLQKILTAFTIGSILEMFYFRLKATIVMQTDHFFPKFAKWQLNLYRFTIVIHPIITTVTFGPSVYAQEVELMRIWKGAVHSVFIIIPTFFLIYAIFFELHANELAQLLLISVAYHGFFSTCAMIIFTKPLKDKFLSWFKRNNRTGNTTIQPSSNRISSVVAA
ncbi:unnamed protein product [Caenorhabditis brenneri]